MPPLGSKQAGWRGFVVNESGQVRTAYATGFPGKPEKCMGYSMTGFPPNPVILVTPVITAIGCDDWGDGNPEEQRQPPVGLALVAVIIALRAVIHGLLLMPLPSNT